MENPTSETNGGELNNSADGGAPIALGAEPVKRGRGRPPGSGNKNKPLSFGNKAEPVSRSAPSVDSLESAKFIGTALVTLVELGESYVHNSCAERIEKRRSDKLAEFKALAEKFSLKETERKLIADSMEKVALRYDVLSKFGPEVVLSVSLGQYAIRQLSLMKFVTNVTKDLDQPATSEKSS